MKCAVFGSKVRCQFDALSAIVLHRNTLFTVSALSQRVFKTKWFTKAAEVAGVSDAELCKVAQALIEGKGDNLGGDVWKKRLDRNAKRGIVINKVGRFWVFVFLFAKKDRENISGVELASFKDLAAAYAGMTSVQIDAALKERKFVEICDV